MLESHEIESAIDSVANKPLGKHLATVMRVYGKDPSTLMKGLDDYLRYMINYILSITPEEYVKDVLSIERLYDILNITLTYMLSLEKKEMHALFPGGLLYLKVYELKEKSIKDLLKITGLHTYLESYVVERISPIEFLARLFTIFKLWREKLLRTRLKKIYSIIYDYMLVRLAYTLGEDFIRRIQVQPYMLSQSDLESIAREKSIEDTVNTISRAYPLLAEIIRSLNKMIKHTVLLDYSHILHLAHESNNLLDPFSPDIYVRAIILIRAENVFTRLSILSIIHKLESEYLKEMLNKWWVR